MESKNKFAVTIKLVLSKNFSKRMFAIYYEINLIFHSFNEFNQFIITSEIKTARQNVIILIIMSRKER